jgi:hypothetical protein
MGIHNLDALIDKSVAESHDATDVPAALERETHDGSGFSMAGVDNASELPPSDFEEDQ